VIRDLVEDDVVDLAQDLFHRVPPGKTCSFDIAFQPKSKAAVRAVYSVYDDAPDSPQNVTATGSGS